MEEPGVFILLGSFLLCFFLFFVFFFLAAFHVFAGGYSVQFFECIGEVSRIVETYQLGYFRHTVILLRFQQDFSLFQSDVPDKIPGRLVFCIGVHDLYPLRLQSFLHLNLDYSGSY